MANARLGCAIGRRWGAGLTCTAVILCALIAPAGMAQAPAVTAASATTSKMEFDVASVKLNKSND